MCALGLVLGKRASKMIKCAKSMGLKWLPKPERCRRKKKCGQERKYLHRTSTKNIQGSTSYKPLVFIEAKNKNKTKMAARQKSEMICSTNRKEQILY